MNREAGWTAVLLQGLSLAVICIGVFLYASASTSAEQVTGILVSLTGLVIGLLATVARSVHDLRARIDGHEATKARSERALEPAGPGPDERHHSHSRADGYHHGAGSQLDNAHRLVQYTSLGGFAVVLILGTIAAVAGPGHGVAVMGSVGIAAGLAAYINRTFQRTYERTLGQRLQYSIYALEAAARREIYEAADEALAGIEDSKQRDAARRRLVDGLVSRLCLPDEGASPRDPALRDRSTR